MSVPAPLHLSGDLVAGRYRLVRPLGQGGMGDVYIAIQEPLGREVALKLMRAGLTGAATARFEREAKSLAAMNHPNIVTLYDYGHTNDGALFMAMELVAGKTVRELLVEAGRRPPREALAIVVDICAALDVTHRKGIVHRDLKPENVMLTDDGRGRRVVKVLDFGIARVHDGDDETNRLTRTGHLVGTPGYMAPESVLEGVFDDPRSDLYAVGVILWELLTCANLFQAPTPIALVMKHALDPPPTLSTVFANTGAPPHPALEALLGRLLHKDRHQRFADAAEVIAAIEALPAEATLPFGGNADVQDAAIAAAPTRVKLNTGAGGTPPDLAPDAATIAGTGQMRTPMPQTGSLARGSSSAITVPTPDAAAVSTTTSTTTSTSPASTSNPRPLIAAAVVVILVAIIGATVLVRRDRRRDQLDPPAPVVPVVPVVTTPTPVPTPVAPAVPVVPVVAETPETPTASDEPTDTPTRTPNDKPADRPRRPRRPRLRDRVPTTTDAPSSPHVPDLTP